MQQEYFSNTVIRYSMEQSPNHHQRPSLYLKQLREREEYHLCDVIILVSDGRVPLHSAIAGAHSIKLARLMDTTELPLILDLSQYPSIAVRKVVDWMYCGSIEICLEHLADYLIIASDLGIVSLCYQLQQTLLEQATKGYVVSALNVVCHLSPVLSLDIVATLVKLIIHRQKSKPLCLEEIQLLTFRSVVVLVSSLVKQSEKIQLINIALDWLRFNVNYLTKIVSEVTVREMSNSELKAFRLMLMSVMGNPATRRKAIVYQKENTDCLAIRVDEMNNTSRSNSELHNMSRNQGIIKQTLNTPIELNELNVFSTDGHIWETKENPKIFSNDFLKWERREKIDYSPSDILHFQQLSDSFSPRNARKGRSFTQSELKEISRLPNMFENKKENCNYHLTTTTTNSNSNRSVTGSMASELGEIMLEEVTATQIFDKTNPKTINSTYANMPKGGVDSFYALEG